MKPTELLKEEHKLIEVLLQVLRKMSEKLSNNEEVLVEHWELAVDFIKNFADKCHHSKEENLLFVALEKAGIPKEGGPIGVMLEEHEQGRNYVRGMVSGLELYKNGGAEAKNVLIENARGYAELLEEHISKEDNILYPMAEMHLSQEENDELLKGFERVEEEEMGQGKHEAYHQILHELEKVYLV